MWDNKEDDDDEDTDVDMVMDDKDIANVVVAVAVAGTTRPSNNVTAIQKEQQDGTGAAIDLCVSVVVPGIAFDAEEDDDGNNDKDMLPPEDNDDDIGFGNNDEDVSQVMEEAINIANGVAVSKLILALVERWEEIEPKDTSAR